MGIAELIRIVDALREIGGRLGLVEQPPVPSPHDRAAEHRPDPRPVPTLVVDDGLDRRRITVKADERSA